MKYHSVKHTIHRKGGPGDDRREHQSVTATAGDHPGGAGAGFGDHAGGRQRLGNGTFGALHPIFGGAGPVFSGLYGFFAGAGQQRHRQRGGAHPGGYPLGPPSDRSPDREKQDRLPKIANRLPGWGRFLYGEALRLQKVRPRHSPGAWVFIS